jgi:hypothetical protein
MPRKRGIFFGRVAAETRHFFGRVAAETRHFLLDVSPR